jgi:uncharacterized membrane protein YecN with MAPEG domain
MTVLPITLTITAAAALINLWLAMRISRMRLAGKVMIGDGGNPALAARMRAQANFTEYTPLFLILLGLVELAQGSATWLWLMAIVYIVSRILHAFGMDRPAPNPFRAIGIGGTLLMTLVLAGYALAMPYLTRAIASPATTTAVVNH